jgi:hypothetical protein
VIDRSITDTDFGRDYLAGKSAKTARRTILAEGIPYLRLRGHWLIKQSDAEAWRESKMQTTPVRNVKSLLSSISDRVLEKRKQSEAVRKARARKAGAA